MTEAEWVAEQHRMQGMLQFLLDPGKLQRTKAGKRKLRLFACGCCRLIWDYLENPRLREAVESAERYADGARDKEGLSTRFRDLIPLTFGGYEPDEPGVQERTVAHMALSCTAAKASSAALKMTMLPLPLAGYSVGRKEGESAICDLIREVFGNPFCPVSFDPAWRTANVVALARTVYEERELPSGHLDRTRLTILADALMDAGCENAEILEHCRGEGPHVRGCWVLDLILGKE